MTATPIVCAVLGALLISLGSFVAIVAPGDGQTGMITFPLWLLGAILGISAITLARSSDAHQGVRPVVALCAAVALLSVAWSIYASIVYVPPGRANAPEASEGEPDERPKGR